MADRKSIESVITPADFDKVWNFLEIKFGYSKEWRIACRLYLGERSEIFSIEPNPVGDFFFFCRLEVEPLLNRALCRPEDYPTFTEMMIWMFGDRLEAKG